MPNTPPLSNWQTRDIESVLHPYTPIHKLKQTGTMVIERGKGVYVYDTQGARLYRRDVRPVVRRPRLRRRGDDRGRNRAAAHPALLPSVRRQGHGTVDRARREAQGDRAGPDLESVLHLVGIGGQRHPGEVRLVHEQRARPAEKEEDHLAHQGLSRRDDHGGLADRAALQSHRLGPAGRPRAAYRLPALLPLRQGRRERGRFPGAHRAVAARPHRARGARHHRRLHRRAGDGRRRRHHPAGRLLSRRSRTCWTSTTSS